MEGNRLPKEQYTTALREEEMLGDLKEGGQFSSGPQNSSQLSMPLEQRRKWKQIPVQKTAVSEGWIHLHDTVQIPGILTVFNPSAIVKWHLNQGDESHNIHVIY